MYSGEMSKDLNDWLIDRSKLKYEFNRDFPVVVIDIVVFTMYKDKLCIILVPAEIEWRTKLILPWGLMVSGYDTRENRNDILYRKTWIKWIYSEQLRAFWKPHRSENLSYQYISLWYFALVNKNRFLNDVDLTKINIIEYNNIDNVDIWYDHREIIKYAKKRLNFRLEYTTISKDILPPKFTLPQMQRTYEMIFWEELDKRNFRRKVEELNIVKFTWEYDRISSNKPAKLYEFVHKELQNLSEDRINYEA